MAKYLASSKKFTKMNKTNWYFSSWWGESEKEREKGERKRSQNNMFTFRIKAHCDQKVKQDASISLSFRVRFHGLAESQN